MTQRLVRAERSDGIRSRQAILDAASKLATVEGLDGISIGRLADHIGMSKSGLYAHFGSKVELQLATIEWAIQIFDRDVMAPAAPYSDPVEYLIALCDSFVDYLERRVFPGGCFFAAAAAEFDTHPGPVRDRIIEVHRDWMANLESYLLRARDAGEIDAREDPAQLAFELDGFLLMANMVFVLYNDPAALMRAKRAVRERLRRVTSNR
jgi:AcrR family transcriptional regulator